MESLDNRLRKANSLLAPYAVPLEGVLGRSDPEPEDETRFPFQRDRDRIIHTQAFRRLKGKTQVFVAGTSDHVRTRLTHTMEVAQVSRDIARTLGLNEDLAECIALAHDLGHPPFGHAGEEILHEWMTTHGSCFEHNEQSLRIVTVIEEHSSLHQGLNLNREILEGLCKHSTPYDHPRGNALRSPTLEAQVVNLADEIAYLSHDCDDGLQSKLFSPEQIRQVLLAKDAFECASGRGTSLRGALIHLLVMDLYASSEEILQSQRITTLSGILHAKHPLIRFSSATRSALDELRAFLWDHLYLHPHVHVCNEQGKAIVSALCNSYASHPTEKILSLQSKTEGALHEAICDYVSGMTDAFALRQAHARGITLPLSIPSPDAMEDTREDPSAPPQ